MALALREPTKLTAPEKGTGYREKGTGYFSAVPRPQSVQSLPTSEK